MAKKTGEPHTGFSGRSLGAMLRGNKSSKSQVTTTNPKTAKKKK